MFISPSVYLTKCFLSKLCSLGQPLPKFAVVRNFVNHCNRAITFQALQPGGRLLFIADQQHTQSLNVRHAATGCFCSGCTGLSSCSGCTEARLLWLLSCSGCFGCLLWLPAFIPYAKVKKLILTHYILFIWKDRCLFFPMLLFPLACCFSLFPMDLPGISIFATAQPLATEPRPAVSLPLRRPWPAASSRWRSATAPPLCSRAATAPRPATALPRRPSQQQTSSGGEKYSGLASNLAHLGRIC